MAAGKKKRVLVSDETRAVAVARVEALVKAGNPTGEAVASVAKELGVSDSAVINWRTLERKKANGTAPKTAPKAAKKTRRKAPWVEEAIARNVRESEQGPAPLDIALDMLSLASKARDALGAASRKRLLEELRVRLG